MASEKSESFQPETPRRQFDLLTLFEWTLLVGLFFAVLAGGNDYILGYGFARLPANDRALEQWFAEESGLSQISIEREGDVVRVRTQRSLFWWSKSDPQPPWASMGYTGLQSQGMEYRASMLKAPLIIGFLLVLVVSLFRQVQHRRQAASTTSTQQKNQ